jgi:hypothetical protein
MINIHDRVAGSKLMISGIGTAPEWRAMVEGELA